MKTSSTTADKEQAPYELARVFFPYHATRTQTVLAAGDRFVYYTTADTAMRILKSREFWLRNALLMNDFSEIAHGWSACGLPMRERPARLSGALSETATQACLTRSRQCTTIFFLRSEMTLI